VANVGQELALCPRRILGPSPRDFHVTRVVSQSLFSFQSFNKLTDLATNRSHHIEQAVVRFLNLFAEELQYA
jgi:hypothetical protein